ncbi:MAG: glycosyltransferase [Candidatus Sabulitectum sp.]|nr:glycosyltransferase [Candidatus Sabulitectum sp.]
MTKTKRESSFPAVCFFQSYYTDYIRSQTLLEGLSQHELRIIPCIVNEHSRLRYPKAILRFLKTKKHSDVVIANFRCWEIFPILRILTRKPIIYDAHISIWQSYCKERRKCRPDSLLGKLLFQIDKYNCKLADMILIDTKAHADYFSDTFGVPGNKFLPIYISCENSLFHPVEQPDIPSVSKTSLFWVGSGIPLQGLAVIIDAMKLITELPVHLRIAGSSPILDKIRQRAISEHVDNISFLGRIPREQVITEIAESDICLGGHYSLVPKARNVIAGKLYEMIAMRKPVIAGDNKAVRELFTHLENVFLCEMGSAASLADAITVLHNSPDLRKQLADSSYDLYYKTLRPKQLVIPLVNAIMSITRN